MENKIILTIAIPTYNRKKDIVKTLNSVISQKSDDVEILVCDNASTDGTEQLMEEYVKNGILRYHRNKRNLGMDGNFLTCLMKARGKYVHLLSDDDLLLPGAVSHILNLINSEQPEYIHLNSFTYTNFYNPKSVVKARIALEDDLITDHKSYYMGLINSYITFLSSTIVKKEAFKKIQDANKYLGTYFLHAHIVFRILEGEGKKVIITKTPFVAAKGNNTGGYNLYKVWVKEYKRLLLLTAVQSGFDEIQMRNLFRKDMKGLVRNFILAFRTTANTFELTHRDVLIKETWRYPDIILRVYPVAFLPRNIVKVLFRSRG